MTATSWGAPEHWPASPFESFRPHTPDIGFREQHSRPATPSTATSWGAPECWPPSPIERTRPQTPDCAQRVHDEDHPVLFNHARPWAHVWPFSEIHNEQKRSLLESRHGSFRFVWPFSEIRKEQRRALLESEHGSFRFVWPFVGKDLQPTIDSTSRGAHNEDYSPSFNYAKAWPHVWPLRNPQGAGAHSVRKPIWKLPIRLAFHGPRHAAAGRSLDTKGITERERERDGDGDGVGNE